MQLRFRYLKNCCQSGVSAMERGDRRRGKTERREYTRHRWQFFLGFREVLYFSCLNLEPPEIVISSFRMLSCDLSVSSRRTEFKYYLSVRSTEVMLWQNPSYGRIRAVAECELWQNPSCDRILAVTESELWQGCRGSEL